jgi:hypothetical protein
MVLSSSYLQEICKNSRRAPDPDPSRVSADKPKPGEVARGNWPCGICHSRGLMLPRGKYEVVYMY